MINQLRHEVQTGNIDDLAHVVSEDQMSDALTKMAEHKVIAALHRTVTTGKIPNTDRHPKFRDLMQNRHKAYHVQNIIDCVEWLIAHIQDPLCIQTFLCADITPHIEQLKQSRRM